MNIYNFDLIITDWRLPAMSGLDFVKQLRTMSPGLIGYPRILKVTGDVHPPTPSKKLIISRPKR